MELIPVASSNIAAAGWENGEMRVKFNNDRVYAAKGVPQHLFQELRSAPSAGSFYNQYLKPYGFVEVFDE